jgi:hypothetical protein
MVFKRINERNGEAEAGRFRESELGSWNVGSQGKPRPLAWWKPRRVQHCGHDERLAVVTGSIGNVMNSIESRHGACLG